MSINSHYWVSRIPDLLKLSFSFDIEMHLEALEKAQFCAKSRKTKILTTGIH